MSPCLPSSIVIATRERPELLRASLDAAHLAMVGLDTEYIVVDQSRDDRSRTVCAPHPDVRYLHSRHVGISFNRNRGAEAAGGEWLLFLDDDTVLADGFGGELRRVLGRSEPVQLVAPLYLDPAGQPLADVVRDRPTQIGATSLWSAWGLCMIVKREAFLRIGGFNEDLGVGCRWGSAEDQDLTLRLIDAGYRCVVEPSLVVTHPRAAEGGRGSRRRAYRYGLGIGAFFRLHVLRSGDPAWRRQARSFMLHPLWEIVHGPARRRTTLRGVEFLGRWLGLLLGPTPPYAGGRIGHSAACIRALAKSRTRSMGSVHG